MSLIEIFSILFIHWVADFILQTDKEAKGKSKNWGDLLGYTTTYSLFWMIPINIMFGINSPSQTTEYYITHTLCFVVVTFLAHTITDYFTSRLNTKLLAKGDTHNFFVSVGFDQILHYVQLFLTYEILKI